MTVVLEKPTAADDQDAQLLFKEARRRRRRLRFMWIATGTTAIILVLGSFGFTLDRSSGRPTSSARITAQPGWPPQLRTGVTLVYALNDLRVLDADSGASQVLPMPAPYGGWDVAKPVGGDSEGTGRLVTGKGSDEPPANG